MPERQTRSAADRHPLWEELIRRCAHGDQKALADLYDNASSLVYGLALRMLSNRADADEITLDVFSQVWKSAAGFESSRGSVASWLVMLTRSRAIDRLRARSLREGREAPLTPDWALSSGVGNPELETESSRIRQRIRRAMETLAPENRRAIELAFFSGMSHSELATHLGLPLGTVKTRIRSSMMKLRESLEDYA